jgi:hypothetical protein
MIRIFILRPHTPSCALSSKNVSILITQLKIVSNLLSTTSCCIFTRVRCRRPRPAVRHRLRPSPVL